MEARLFDPSFPPEYTTAEWYAGVARAPHLEQPYHRARLELAADFARQAVREHQAASISDMGAGDGGLLSLIADLGVSAWGYDLIEANVKAAVGERKVPVTLADVLSDPVSWGDLALCTELLEHLIDPHAFVRAIPSRLLVASSPHGEHEGHHYEFHTWGWDMDGYRALLEQGGFQVIRHESIGFQVILGVRA